jgi:DNA processing protein
LLGFILEPAIDPHTYWPADQLEEWQAWLQLCFTPGVGPATAQVLLTEFGLPQAVLEQSAAALRKVAPADVVQQLLSPSEKTQQALQTSLHWLAHTPNAGLLTFSDAQYPKQLLDLHDAPPVLFYRGQLSCLDKPRLAVVGSRHGSQAGLMHAHAFAKLLAGQGLCIVSGLALGIDAAAHRGALEAGGATVAVIGNGPDRCYPPANRVLMQQIVDNGLVLSEFAPGVGALPAHFPQRNRLIAALGLGTLVVEAAKQSGSLITARLAAELGREVFAIPGSIDSPVSKGCHSLIKQGAKLVDEAQDIAIELAAKVPALAQYKAPAATRKASGRATRKRPDSANTQANASAKSALNPVDPALYGPLQQHLGFAPISPETLASLTNLQVHTIMEMLSFIELDGQIERLADGRVQRLPLATDIEP